MAVLFTTILIFLKQIRILECAIISPLDSWTVIDTPPIPIAESGWITGIDNNKIWLIGGYQADHILYYSLVTLDFTNTLDALPFTGGLTPDSQSYTQLNRSIYFEHDFKLLKFDMDTGQLDASFDKSLPIQRNSPCIVNDGRYIFLIGGGFCPSGRELQVYDTITDQWSQGKTLSINSGRALASCAVSPDNNYLYVFGGVTQCNIPHNDYALQSIGKISIADKTNINTVSDVSLSWVALQDSSASINIMMSNLYYARAVAIGDYIYVIGGRDANNDEAAEVMILDPFNDQINYTVPLPTGRSSPGVIGVDGTIYIFGGALGEDLDSWAKSNTLTDAPTPSVCNSRKSVPYIYRLLNLFKTADINIICTNVANRSHFTTQQISNIISNE